jgi:hypothetical protein
MGVGATLSVSFAAAPIAPGERVRLPFGAARRGVVSWNSLADTGELWLRAYGRDGSAGARLPLARWSPAERRSFNGRDALIAVEVDVVSALAPLAWLEIEASAPLELLTLASPPPPAAPRGASGRRFDLAVPPRSQYTDERTPLSPEQSLRARGWCSPASLAMVLAYFGRELALTDVAERVYDAAYGGTGNWAFNTALAGSLGLRAYVAFLPDLRAAEDCLASGTPPILSFAWRKAELTGAPLPESDGHLAVLRGFDERGEPLFNDPASPGVRTSYPRAEFEAVWLRHGGVAYVVAAPDRAGTSGCRR